LHYGWALFPPEKQAGAWNIGGSIARVCLLGVIVWRVRSRLVVLLSAWWFSEEALVIGCNAAYMWAPWARAPGEAMCSSLLDFDLGKIGAVVALLMAWTVWRQPVSSDR
jgi:hypothetical protein